MVPPAVRGDGDVAWARACARDDPDCASGQSWRFKFPFCSLDIPAKLQNRPASREYESPQTFGLLDGSRNGSTRDSALVRSIAPRSSRPELSCMFLSLIPTRCSAAAPLILGQPIANFSTPTSNNLRLICLNIAAYHITTWGDKNTWLTCCFSCGAQSATSIRRCSRLGQLPTPARPSVSAGRT